jgi:hypothetical protein
VTDTRQRLQTRRRVSLGRPSLRVRACGQVGECVVRLHIIAANGPLLARLCANHASCAHEE